MHRKNALNKLPLTESQQEAPPVSQSFLVLN